MRPMESSGFNSQKAFKKVLSLNSAKNECLVPVYRHWYLNLHVHQGDSTSISIILFYRSGFHRSGNESMATVNAVNSERFWTR